MTESEFEVLTPAQTREEFAPSLNGMSIWEKALICDYCSQHPEGKVILLKWQASAINLMCLDCFEAMCQRVWNSHS